jgi:hypothetical protein
MIGEKFEQSVFAQVVPLGELDVLISGKTPSPSLQQALHKEKVTTIIAQAKEKKDEVVERDFQCKQAGDCNVPSTASTRRSQLRF